mmetsp:Transcript_9057/g.11682  ORF Transcript_9057/g.11682 Transcript_9057/m.11682 type:complete len:457 (+) Transcript_9057:505-1875(+)
MPNSNICNIATSLPQRVGEPDCRDYLRTGRCKYGESCKYHHPPNVQSGGGIASINPGEPPFPIRPGEPSCQYFLKHGTCKFGQTCKFNHPPNFRAHVPEQLLPQRPGEPDCIYFLRNGRCKYGITCKYHHPIRNVRSASLGNDPRPSTHYILMEPANVVMITQNAQGQFASTQQGLFPGSPMMVPASALSSSMTTSSVASSYETAQSNVGGEYPSWQQQSHQRRVRINSVSSSLSMEEHLHRPVRSESVSSLRESASASSLKELPHAVPSSINNPVKVENYDEDLSEMTSALLNMIDHEDRPSPSTQTSSNRIYSTPLTSPKIEPQPTPEIMPQYYQDYGRHGPVEYVERTRTVLDISKGATINQYDRVPPGPNLLPPPMRGMPQDQVNMQGHPHMFPSEPPTSIPNSCLYLREPSRVENQPRSLSSVNEEAHAQNWSPSSWQPSSSVPNTFFPRL